MILFGWPILLVVALYQLLTRLTARERIAALPPEDGTTAKDIIEKWPDSNQGGTPTDRITGQDSDRPGDGPGK